MGGTRLKGSQEKIKKNEEKVAGGFTGPRVIWTEHFLVTQAEEKATDGMPEIKKRRAHKVLSVGITFTSFPLRKIDI